MEDQVTGKIAILSAFVGATATRFCIDIDPIGERIAIASVPIEFNQREAGEICISISSLLSQQPGMEALEQAKCIILGCPDCKTAYVCFCHASLPHEQLLRYIGLIHQREQLTEHLERSFDPSLSQRQSLESLLNQSSDDKI